MTFRLGGFRGIHTGILAGVARGTGKGVKGI